MSEKVMLFVTKYFKKDAKSLSEQLAHLSETYVKYASLTKEISEVFEKHGQSNPLLACPSCNSPVLLEFHNCPLCNEVLLSNSKKETVVSKTEEKRLVVQKGKQTEIEDAIKEETKLIEEGLKEVEKKQTKLKVVEESKPAKKEVSVPSIDEINILRTVGLNKLAEKHNLDIDEEVKENTKKFRAVVIELLHGSKEEKKVTKTKEVVKEKPVKKVVEEDDFDADFEEEVEEKPKKQTVKKSEKVEELQPVEEEVEEDTYPSTAEINKMSLAELEALSVKEKLRVNFKKLKGDLKEARKLVNEAIDLAIENGEPQSDYVVEEVVKNAPKNSGNKKAVEEDMEDDFDLDGLNFDDLDDLEDTDSEIED